MEWTGTRPAIAGSLRAEIPRLLALALPVVFVQVGMMAMGVVDTMVVGRLSAVDLAAVALGNLYFFSVMVVGWGVLMALDPVVSQAVGAKDDLAISRGLQRGFVIGGALILPCILAMLPAQAVLRLLGQPADVVPVAARYTWACIPGVPAFLGFAVLRQTLQAMHRMRPIVWTIIAGNIVNLALNVVLVFGLLGFPRLGAVGSGCATSISRWFLFLSLAETAWAGLKPYLIPLRPEALAAAPLKRMLRIGLPIGGQYGLEVGAFAAIALLMGLIGTREIAGHQVAINLASLTFMVPLGVSSAAAIRVGHAVGRGDPAGARLAARAALFCGALFMSGTAALFIAAPGPLVWLYTRDAEVVALAVALLPIAGFFQVFDGLQVVSIGVLRGLGDTTTPLLVNVLGFWLLGLPVSLWLAFVHHSGARGLWWGMVVALGAVAVFLLLRVRVRLARGMPRLVVDEAPLSE